MSFLHDPGDLARTPLAAILLEALNQRATGVLEVAHGDGTSRLWLRDGRPVGAQVVAGIRPLGHLLLQAGLIDIDALSRSLAVMAERGRPQGEILVEMGVVARDQVDRVLAEQQAGYFGLIAALEAGAYRFDASARVPAWADGNLLSPLRTIVDALERPQADALVISALQPVASGMVRLTAGYRDVAAAFRWTAPERALVQRLEGGAALEAFFARSDVPPERGRAIVAALLLLGLAAASEPLQVAGEATASLDLGPGHGAAPPPSPAPGRRSDPAEARARRQRLLQQAMRNMGVGPFAGPGRSQSPPPPAPPQPAAPGGVAARPGQPAAAVPPGEAALRAALAAAAPRAREQDYFRRLGVAETAGRDEVKQAFLSIARRLHPDRFAAPALQDLAETVKEFFTAVNEAYEVLSDDRRRAEYLATRKAAGSSQVEAGRVDAVKGEACLRTRDWARARGFFEVAVRSDPRPEYQAALALAMISDPAFRDRERVRSLAEEARRDAGCDRAAYVAGLLARDDGDVARAEKHFRAALAANPRNADAVRELRLVERKRR
jgi:curved DNA-binding protein CbpA